MAEVGRLQAGGNAGGQNPTCRSYHECGKIITLESTRNAIYAMGMIS